MPRRVFFSFDYKNIYKVGLIVKNLPGIITTAAAGFVDSTEWDEQKVKGDLEIKEMIDRAIEGTTVTVVFITEGVLAPAKLDQSLKPISDAANVFMGAFNKLRG